MAELIWSPRSLKDLEIIYEYIKQDSVEAASEFVNELIFEAIGITNFPYKGRSVPELKKDQIREKIYKSYRIVYRITNANIELVTFLHQSRRLIRQEFK
ncbi:type II toxin-antitoxin system RelE/ParE family toxin [Cohnella silvisoli]|uniref:Type II toxin-antitoxin system RelE/ParE family toxin n=1 Tax=Cohnella silvisoli TaxID=2873699 RepID=A0ABV1L1D7_9BACL|nr:type II toxin-antitoxin system RelE/ParE family toxin [Cohnella silvisoli]MCD9024953.1 type II toxin-antitoxin system RelE/ParE family toxin [Cohnella silvisoli]